MAGIKDYSPIPAANTALFPEGMAPSAVNDGMRQVQADLRDWYNDAQWAVYGDGDAAFTVSYVSPISFAIVGADVAAVYHAGRRVKATGALTGTIYGSITASSFATNTTVTVQWDSGALQNETLTVSLGIVSAANTALPVAGATTPGGVRLATSGETGAGVLTDKAVTPAGLAAAPMVWTTGHVFRSADDTAAEIAAIDLDRASPSPAANDLLMALRWRMRDGGGGTDTAAKILAKLLDPTAGSEDAELQLATVVAGTLAARLILGQGAYTPNAPGGDKGPDSVNALELYARGNPVGYQAINVQSGGAYALVQNDLNAVVKLTAAAGCTVTLPSIAAVGPGWRVRLLNGSGPGGGDVTIQRFGSDPIDGGGTTVKLQPAPGRNVLDWWTDGVGWFTSERRFRSTAQTISSGAIAAVSHGLGATPRDVRLRLKCLTAQAAFEVGDEIHYNYSVSDVAGAQRGVSILADPINVEVSTTSNANVFALISEGGGVAVALTNTNWEYYVEAEY